MDVCEMMRWLAKEEPLAASASVDVNGWIWDSPPLALWLDGMAYKLGEDGEYHGWPDGEAMCRDLFGDENAFFEGI